MPRAKEVRKKLHVLYEYGVVVDNDPMSDSVSNGVQFQISHNPVRNVQDFEAGTPGERYLDFKELRYLLTLLANEKYVLLPDVHALIEQGSIRAVSVHSSYVTYKKLGLSRNKIKSF
jgi:hypothetical protein